MCVSFFILFPNETGSTGAHPRLLFLLAFGRDEYLLRPSKSTAWWADQPHILGGRDVQAGGTWLGVAPTAARVAWLTNLRQSDPDPAQQTAAAKYEHKHSRGELPTCFLSSSTSPHEFCAAIEGDRFHGFNFVCVDLRMGQACYTHNAPNDVASASGSAAQHRPAVHPLQPGRVYGLSNGLLDEWDKVTGGVQLMSELLGVPCPTNTTTAKATSDNNGYSEDCGRIAGSATAARPPSEVPWEALFSRLLGDATRNEAAAPRSPRSGAPLPAAALNADDHLEYVASSRFVQHVPSKFGPYGTRSQTVLAVWADGHGELRERFWEAKPTTQASTFHATDGTGGTEAAIMSGQWQEVKHALRVAL